MDMLASLIGQVEEQIGLDSLVLGETFYFFTVVIMWLIHAGFMMYEAGAARRKNIMSTAMKNILTIAVVTPTFYYFGWYIYGCFEHGGPAEGHAGPSEFPGFCGATAPVGRPGRAEPVRPHQPRLLPRVPSLLVDDGLDHVGRIDRARQALCVPASLGAPRFRGVDHGRRVGLELRRLAVTNYGFHDSIASMVVHGVAGVFTLGVLIHLGPRIGKYDREGRARRSSPTTRT